MCSMVLLMHDLEEDRQKGVRQSQPMWWVGMWNGWSFGLMCVCVKCFVRVSEAVCYNCFIRWVLILSRNQLGESNWSFDPVPGWQADNIRRSILTTPLSLNENRDPREKVPHRSGSQSSCCQVPTFEQHQGICMTPLAICDGCHCGGRFVRAN